MERQLQLAPESRGMLQATFLVQKEEPSRGKRASVIILKFRQESASTLLTPLLDFLPPLPTLLCVADDF